jgi:hypothetical protein
LIVTIFASPATYADPTRRANSQIASADKL